MHFFSRAVKCGRESLSRDVCLEKQDCNFKHKQNSMKKLFFPGNKCNFKLNGKERLEECINISVLDCLTGQGIQD